MSEADTATIEGGCNCGAVRYRIAGAPIAVVACHCTSCRRQSGATYSVNIVAKTRDVTVEGSLGAYEDNDTSSGKPVIREFCSRCGSPIRSVITAQPAIVAIKAGTADNASDFAPGLHVWTSSKLAWVEIPAGLPALPRDPS